MRQRKKIRRLTLGEKAELALKAAVRKVIEENARLGLPVYVGHDGKVVKLQPEEVRRLSNTFGKARQVEGD